MMNQTHTTLIALLAAVLLALPAAALADPIPVTDTITIEGELTETDPLAWDGSLAEDGSQLVFHYDVIDFVATATSTITITFNSDAFAPYFGWGFDLGLSDGWPSGSSAPYDLLNWEYCLDAPGSQSAPFINPKIGQTFQVLVATCGYNPTALGAYTLTLDDGVVPMPEPGSLALLGIGLIGLAAARRRRQR